MTRRGLFISIAAALGAATQASSLKGALSAFVESLKPKSRIGHLVSQYYKRAGLSSLRHKFVFGGTSYRNTDIYDDIIAPQSGKTIQWFRYGKPNE